MWAHLFVAKLRGISHWPRAFHPKTSNVSSSYRRAVWAWPAAACVTFFFASVITGTLHWPWKFWPKAMEVPSLRTTTVCESPAATCLTPAASFGTSRCPETFQPQVTTLPSARRKTEWQPPAAICRTLFGGFSAKASVMLHCPWQFSPKAMAFPSSRRRSVWEAPAATSLTFLVPSQEGTSHWPLSFRPKAMIAPLAKSKTVCRAPAAACTTAAGSRLGMVTVFSSVVILSVLSSSLSYASEAHFSNSQPRHYLYLWRWQLRASPKRWGVGLFARAAMITRKHVHIFRDHPWACGPSISEEVDPSNLHQADPKTTGRVSLEKSSSAKQEEDALGCPPLSEPRVLQANIHGLRSSSLLTWLVTSPTGFITTWETSGLWISEGGCSLRAKRIRVLGYVAIAHGKGQAQQILYRDVLERLRLYFKKLHLGNHNRAEQECNFSICFARMSHAQSVLCPKQTSWMRQ